MNDRAKDRPVVLCFDGSQDAEDAIAHAGALLGDRAAVVLTVREPLELWAPYDPASILDAGLNKLADKKLGLDEIADEFAHKQVDRGVELARAAGFKARARVGHGKPWKQICELGDELDASAIVLGARGLSRIRSALLGSVSSTVSVHAGRPVLIVHEAPRASRRRGAAARGGRASAGSGRGADRR